MRTLISAALLFLTLQHAKASQCVATDKSGFSYDVSFHGSTVDVVTEGAGWLLEFSPQRSTASRKVYAYQYLVVVLENGKVSLFDFQQHDYYFFEQPCSPQAAPKAIYAPQPQPVAKKVVGNIQLETIYTDQCYDAVTFYQLISQKTNGTIVFNVQCGGYGYSPSGVLMQTMNGNASVKLTSGTTLQLATIYTDQCYDAVTFYQLAAQKTNGAIVFNVRCGEYGYSPDGALMQKLDGTVTVR